MKIISVLACLLPVASCVAQMLSSSGVVRITGDPATGHQISETFQVEYVPGVNFDGYRVLSYLEFSDVQGHFLRPNPTQVGFEPGTEIGPSTTPYTDPPIASPSRIRLSSYYWQVAYPANRLSSRLINDYFPNKTSIYLGFSRYFQGRWQYGWLHMERATARFEEMLLPTGEEKQFVFLANGFAVHPIPDRPIRAGMEPDLPTLTTELTTVDGGGQAIRVSWPSGWPGMVLEYASELAQPTEWRPVEGVVGSGALMELPEDGQLFFRLRYAP